MFVTNVKAITKERETVHITHCGEHIPISAHTITAMRGLHDFIESLLFIHTLKAMSLVQPCHENIAIN